jgi:1A family penicillin-binding protein
MPKKIIKKQAPKKQPKKRHISKLWLLAFLPLIVALGAFYFYILKDLPSPTRLKSASRALSTKIYDRNNVLLYTIYSDKNQSFLPLSQIPANLQHATIAIEDKDFYKHGAIDIQGIARAAYATLFKKDLQGGSTLTQQLVKNTLLTPDRTIQRKVKEVVLSFATELLYNKNQVLEMYLNQVPYGGTAYGVEAAAQTYFGKSAKKLDLAESALLAGLPQNPTTYSPFGARPELAKQRQHAVLAAMLKAGYITKAAYDQAVKEPLTYKRLSNPIKAPHFVFYVKELLVKKYGIQQVEQGGLKVKTSLDLALQETAQASLSAEVDQIKRFKVSNGAALVMRPGTGEILAMVGSKDYFDPSIDGNVNITTSLRQPGSSIKPINYAVGLMQGYGASTLFLDVKSCFPNPGAAAYCPHNYDNRFHGPVTMRQALANSFNIPAVQMLKLNGLDAMIATASAMGISTFTDPSRYGLSLTLGGGEVRMLDMATAFGVFANSGYRIDPHPILQVTDSSGKILEEYTPPQSPIFGKKVLPAGVTYIISDILADNQARAAEFGTNSALYIPHQFVSVKTGTTNDLKDNWTIGYTPDYVVATWVGNSDSSPMSGVVSGITGAAPIWHDLMTFLLQDTTVKEQLKPADVSSRAECSLPASPDQPNQPAPACSGKADLTLKGVPQKTNVQTKQEATWVDKTTGDIAQPGQTDNLEAKEETIMTDKLGNRYCVTCNHSTPTPTP